ncbi:uncharacterized protein LOC142991173 [Genypterus blacodes]|uniref:uncharacterized protein LOC142991173 n=1 Tax=Genypterus blacodes TaxID=154954 RepID=UPI003F76F41B
MEKAYKELYKEFLSLRSLCMRQATMLHHLTTALQKHRGVTIPQDELGDLVSIPVQCTQKSPAHLLEAPQPPAGTKHNIRTQGGFDLLPRSTGTFSDLLDEDMSRLGLNVHSQRKEAHAISAAHPSGWHQAPSSVPQNTAQDAPVGGRMPQTAWITRTNCHSPLPEVQSGGMLMSDVEMQSHTCEYCQAVFPRDTATTGGFLRHLYTHIT